MFNVTRYYVSVVQTQPAQTGTFNVCSLWSMYRNRTVKDMCWQYETDNTDHVIVCDRDAPQIKRITLERGVDGLGFSIVGGYGSPHGDLPIYVKTVFAKGAAAENGVLKRGDQIMSVNNETLEGATHEQAVQILKRAKGTIELVVLSWHEARVAPVVAMVITRQPSDRSRWQVGIEWSSVSFCLTIGDNHHSGSGQPLRGQWCCVIHGNGRCVGKILDGLPGNRIFDE